MKWIIKMRFIKIISLIISDIIKLNLKNLFY